MYSLRSWQLQCNLPAPAEDYNAKVGFCALYWKLDSLSLLLSAQRCADFTKDKNCVWCVLSVGTLHETSIYILGTALGVLIDGNICLWKVTLTVAKPTGIVWCSASLSSLCLCAGFHRRGFVAKNWGTSVTFCKNSFYLLQMHAAPARSERPCRSAHLLKADQWSSNLSFAACKLLQSFLQPYVKLSET